MQWGVITVLYRTCYASEHKKVTGKRRRQKKRKNINHWKVTLKHVRNVVRPTFFRRLPRTGENPEYKRSEVKVWRTKGCDRAQWILWKCIGEKFKTMEILDYSTTNTSRQKNNRVCCPVLVVHRQLLVRASMKIKVVQEWECWNIIRSKRAPIYIW